MGGEENILIILSSPSGVGKTTLTKKIQQKYQSFKISVSHTTRLPRSNEVDGVDYHFVSKEKFKKLSIKTARIGNSDRSKLKVVFTALHGTSFKLIPEILKSSGYSDVKLVEDQMIPDGK